MELKDLHEEVFKFLLEKRKADVSLRYTMRKNDVRESLTNGEWFHGSRPRQELYISFWQVWGVDGKSTFPSIRFQIKVDGECGLYIDAKQKHGEELWGSLATALGLKDTKRVGDRWMKIYESKDFKKSLEYFISIEKPYIDSFFKLRGVDKDFPSIAEVDFLARFEQIQNLRAKQEDKRFQQFINGKLFVNGLILENINAFKDLNLTFEKPITCFVGGNGSGKTTILRAIALGLVGFNGLKKKPNLLAIREARSDVFFQPKGSIEVRYQHQNEQHDFGVTFSSIEKGREAREGENMKTEGGLLGQEDALNALVVGFAQQSSATPRMSKRHRPNMADLDALILNESDNRFDEFVEWFKEGLKKDSDDYKSFRSLISQIIDIINNCMKTNEEDNKNDIDFIGFTKINLKTRNNPNGIPIDKLSQGYRNLLGWVGFFAKRLYEYHTGLIDDGVLSEEIKFMDLPAVCLIDEIDTYLHPDWQYSILKGLVESFPNVQFFITSHSPFVLTSVPSDKITIYEIDTEGGENKDEIVVDEIDENLSGADANRATDKISSHRSKRPLKLFKVLQNNIDNNRLEDAEQILNQLIEDEKVDENRDLEILRAKRLIRTKKLLQSTKPATL
jgi:predicted ATP-binding protein involved in virulence